MSSIIHKSLPVLQFTLLLSLILYFGKPVLIPLSFSLLIACMVYPVCNWLEGHRLPRILSIFLSLGIIILLVALMCAVLWAMLHSLLTKWPEIKLKLLAVINGLSAYASTRLNIRLDQQEKWLNNAIDTLPAMVVSKAGGVLYQSAVSSVLLFLIPIIAGLILYYRRIVLELACLLYKGESRESVRNLLHLTIYTYYNFIKGMALVYLIVGLLNSAGLWLLGIPNPVMYGFLVAIMTFIPYVGIFIAGALPVSVAWITYGELWYPMAVIVLFAIIQYLEANLIFPLAVGNRLRINALVTLIMVLLGGLIWGGAGMILFVPFAAIIKLLADHSGHKNIISTLFGENIASEK